MRNYSCSIGIKYPHNYRVKYNDPETQIYLLCFILQGHVIKCVVPHLTVIFLQT